MKIVKYERESKECAIRGIKIWERGKNVCDKKTTQRDRESLRLMKLNVTQLS